MPPVTRSALVALLAVAPLAAAPQQPPQVTRITQIGCDACGGPTEFGEIYDVGVGAGGSVLVVDESAPMLRVFGRDGRLTWSGGRAGAGPGEYRYPMRVAVGADRSMHVVDMRLRRITHLGPTGAVVRTVAFERFPAGVAALPRTGDLVVLSDDFRGTLTVERWSAAGDSGRLVTRLTRPPTAAPMSIPSVAATLGGEVAVGLDGAEYRIRRFGPTGQPLADIVRDIPRERRTPEEQAELEARLRAGPAMARRERAQTKSSPPLVTPSTGAGELKPHFVIDGLRYDERGRLWVLTMRGGPSRTVFDVFAPTGAFLGSVTLPTPTRTFALGDGHLVTGGENDDGIPIVTVWAVKG